jgi:carbon storage regulator
MLVLSRKSEESVRVGDNIVITIGEIKDGNVRLIFDVPKDLKIVRDNAKTKERKPKTKME